MDIKDIRDFQYIMFVTDCLHTIRGGYRIISYYIYIYIYFIISRQEFRIHFKIGILAQKLKESIWVCFVLGGFVLGWVSLVMVCIGSVLFGEALSYTLSPLTVSKGLRVDIIWFPLPPIPWSCIHTIHSIRWDLFLSSAHETSVSSDTKFFSCLKSQY